MPVYFRPIVNYRHNLKVLSLDDVNFNEGSSAYDTLCMLINLQELHIKQVNGHLFLSCYLTKQVIITKENPMRKGLRVLTMQNVYSHHSELDPSLVLIQVCKAFPNLERLTFGTDENLYLTTQDRSSNYLNLTKIK